MPAPRTILATSVGGLAALLLAAGTGPSTAATSPHIAFGVPRIVDPVHVYGEPDIKVGPDGAIYVSGPQGTGVQRSIWNVSRDNGDSYRLVQDSKTGTAYPSSLIPTKSTLGPGGGDTEIAISRHNQVFYADLYALVCFTTAYTTTDGQHVTSTPEGCSLPLADRQWMAIYDPTANDHPISPYHGNRPLVYMKYSDEGVLGGSRVDYTTADDPSNWHLGDPAAEFANTSGVGPTDAPVVVDQHTGDLLTVVNQGSHHGLALAVGVPSANAHLTFHYDPIVASLPGDASTLFPAFSEDTSRNLYAAWVDAKTFQVSYAWAAPNAKGTDWGAWHGPYRVNRPPSNVQVMPWIAAGGKGLLDVVWYGTDKTLAQLGPNGPSAQKHQAWWTYFAQIDHANTVHPHIVQSRASQHPMHYNDICLLGTGCITQTGDRNLADFFEVTIDRAGRARIVFDDTSNGLASPLGAAPAVDHSGAALVTVATQQTGLNAWTGKPLGARETTAPRSGITDPTGDARYPVIGGARVPGADITALSLKRTASALQVTVRTKAGTLADAATAAKAAYGRLVVRWQMGNTLYHAGVDEPAVGGTPTYYAGATQSTDSCSVSACDPHTLDYVAPPLPGAANATGSAKTSPEGTTYTINVPLSAIGNPSKKRRLEEVAGYVFAAPVPGSVPDSKPQSDVDEVPLELEGTKTFNFVPAATASHSSSVGSTATQPAATRSHRHGSLAFTGAPVTLPIAGLACLVIALVVFRRRRASR